MSHVPEVIILLCNMLIWNLCHSLTFNNLSAIDSNFLQLTLTWLAAIFIASSRFYFESCFSFLNFSLSNIYLNLSIWWLSCTPLKISIFYIFSRSFLQHVTSNIFFQLKSFFLFSNLLIFISSLFAIFFKPEFSLSCWGFQLHFWCFLWPLVNVFAISKVMLPWLYKFIIAYIVFEIISYISRQSLQIWNIKNQNKYQ